MGAGRKTQTFVASENPGTGKCETNGQRIRNLTKSELGGVIFGCKNNTKNECTSKELFGLPQIHISYVKNIGTGLPLFLFNYTDKMLHGIFEAASNGGWRIDPNAWTGNEFSVTPFPAQVRIRIRQKCQPLSEKQFKPIIIDNYYEDRHFYFELSQVQTEKLISLFMSSNTTASTSSSSQCTVNREPKLKALAESNRGKKADGIEPNALNEDASSQDDPSLDLARHMAGRILDDEEAKEVGHEGGVGRVGTSSVPRSWSSLFKAPTNTSNAEPKSCSDMNSSGQDLALPSDSDHADWGWVSPRFDPAFDVAVNSSKASIGGLQKNQEHPSPGQNGGGALNSFNPAVGSNSVAHYAPHTNVTAGNSEADKGNSVIGLESNPSYNPNADCNSEDSESGSPTPLEVEKVTSGFESQIGANNNLLKSKPSEYLYSVVSKLLGDVNELKLSRLEQENKITSLEIDVIKSRFEIQRLKDTWNTLECQSSIKTGSLKEESKSTDNPHHQAPDSPILVVGGNSGSVWLKTTEYYFPSSDCTEPRCPMRIALPHSSATKLKGEIYVLGGGGMNQEWHNEVESYNPVSNNWTSFPPLTRKKGNLASVSFNDKIYATGGGDGFGCFPEVEMYLLDLGRWISSTPMLQKRFSHGAEEINGAIYVAGGYDGKFHLSSVERFDPRECSWTKLESMPANRSCHSLAVLNDKLFAVGGYDGNSFLSKVDIFDPRKGLWMSGEPMKNSRAYATATVIGDGIYAIGGMTDNCEFVGPVEYYKEGHGWQATNLKGIGKRLYFSAIVL